jgi:hypothetical protein
MLVVISIFLAASYVSAGGVGGSGIIFYGEHCELCGDYAYCTKTPTHDEAVSALKSHYDKRRLRVIVLRQKDRFLEAEIYNNGSRIDRILLDLRTGRIRSIY